MSVGFVYFFRSFKTGWVISADWLTIKSYIAKPKYWILPATIPHRTFIRVLAIAMNVIVNILFPDWGDVEFV